MHPTDSPSIRRDLLIMALGWAGAQIVFNGYEAHVPLGKRILKAGMLFGVLTGIRARWGRHVFTAVVASMTVGIAILHGYWFHIRHGIHWRTAEPRERYLRLIRHPSEIPFGVDRMRDQTT